MKIRSLLMWIHLVLGLTGAVILLIVSVTGVYITFREPLRLWLNPIPRVAEFPGSPDVPAMVAAVEAQFAPRRVVSINAPDQDEAWVARLRDRTAVFVNPSSATVIGSRPARFASLENLNSVMGRLHENLLLGPRGRLVVTAATIEAILLALTGLWLWWRKKYWRFRPWRGSVFRVSWDLHNASAIWFLVPVLVMAGSGVLIYEPRPVFRLMGGPAPYQSAPPRSQAVASDESTPVPLSRVISVADSAVPGEPMRLLSIPEAPTGSFSVQKERETIYVEQFSGALLEVRPHRVPSAGDRAVGTVLQVHTGALFGWPGRTMMTLGSLMLVVMTITGTVLGWKRLLILAGRRAAD